MIIQCNDLILAQSGAPCNYTAQFTFQWKRPLTRQVCYYCVMPVIYTSPWSQAIVTSAEDLLIRSLGIENEDKFLLSHCRIQHMSPSVLHTLCFT